MYLLVFAAVVIALVLLMLAGARPRLALVVAAGLWLTYAYWEWLVATGVVCGPECNIRVDLVLFFPILAAATFYAYSAYKRPDGMRSVTGFALSAVGLALLALLLLGGGRIGYAAAAGAAALALAGYAMIARPPP